MHILTPAVRRPARLALLAVFAVPLACVEHKPAAPGDSAVIQPAAADFAAGVSLGAGERRAAASPAPAREKTGSAPPASVEARAQQAASSGMVIRNGNVSVEVDSVEAAIATLRRLAASLGGYVGNLSTQTGERQVRSASLELKVPAARFDEAMAGMAPLGNVERSTATTEDVGEEFVDISARVTNGKRLEARLVALLANRTGRLDDVLAVERELARVREEIERHEGRLRYLGARVATSTIVATVHEKYPVVSQPGTNVIANAFVRMWRNFVRFVAGAIELLGIVIPVAALVWLGSRIWKRLHRGPNRPLVQPG